MVSWEGRELTAPMRCPLEPGKALSLSPRCLQGHAILSHWLLLSLSFLEEAGTVCAGSEASELPGPMGPVPLTTLWKDLGEGVSEPLSLEKCQCHDHCPKPERGCGVRWTQSFLSLVL